MNPDLPTLLHRWREGSLTSEEMSALTTQLTQPEARQALRQDWFLDAALPQALAASAVIVRTPQPSWLARLSQWFAREEEIALGALHLWARTSFAALAVGVLTTAWFAWPQRHNHQGQTDAEQVAQIIFQKHFHDAD
jgi:hypothetical protein